MGLPVQPASDNECARWLQERLEPWPTEQGGITVASLVPRGFDSYARVRKSDGDTLSVDQATRLGELLSGSSGAEPSCCFAVWEGYSVGVTEDGEWIHFDRFDAPSFDLPSRRFVLFSGPVSDIAKFTWEGMFLAPDIWWPADHAWCVASDTDLAHVYVGASQEAVEGLLADRELSTEPSAPEYRIDLDPDAGH